MCELHVTPFDERLSRWSSQTPRWELSASRCGRPATREQSHAGVNRRRETAGSWRIETHDRPDAAGLLPWQHLRLTLYVL